MRYVRELTEENIKLINSYLELELSMEEAFYSLEPKFRGVFEGDDISNMVEEDCCIFDFSQKREKKFLKTINDNYLMGAVELSDMIYAYIISAPKNMHDQLVDAYIPLSWLIVRNMKKFKPDDLLLIDGVIERYANVIGGTPLDDNGKLIYKKICKRSLPDSFMELYNLTYKNDFMKLYYAWRFIVEAKDLLSKVKLDRPMNVGNIMPDLITFLRGTGEEELAESFDNYLSKQK